MPVFLENTPDNGASAALKAYSPKFFNSALTGSGKSIGILCDTLNPGALTYHPVITSEHINCKKEHYTNGNTKVNKIPVNPLTTRAWGHVRQMALPDKLDAAIMAQSVPATEKTGVHVEFFTLMKPHSIIMEETDNGTPGGSAGANGTKVSNKTKKVTVCYHVFVYAISDWNTSEVTVLTDYDLQTSMDKLMRFANNIQGADKNACTHFYACDTVDEYAKVFTHLENRGYKVDRQSIVDYLNNYSIYDAMVKRSEEWQTSINTTQTWLFESLAKHMVPQGYVFQKFDASGNPVKPTGDILEVMTTMNEQLEYLEAYPIPLDLYRDIYNSLNQIFDPSLRMEFCKHNLNLLLSDTLYSLNNKKASLAQIQLPANPKPPIGPNGTIYSPEQTRAITCTDPLVLIQAGAGTGKSTTILARVNWMIDNGINPKDIMIISFTNAAADNIMTKNPFIQSMTIAKMIHTIYCANFPEHELSTPETLSNTLDIYYPNDPLANQFRKRVSEMEEKGKSKTDLGTAYTQMNNFVERHLDDIIKLLDGVKQTTLALEIIICYQMIDRLVEPPEIASKYLIIDEVQDNSVFEFVYALKYVDKHNEAMLIVGKN